ncbi:MAG: 2-C-methyl-D-erythritol 4-phosphate cytidylyltransferase [Candidatus Aminicenantes bacterium]|nr:2-C-methyl-D-erythritol 4-phosphate cytidylyltransferase [Candidatus Aminicenantes bacterium]
MKGVGAVIVAAGAGRRFGGAKPFALLAGRPLVEWSLAVFENHPLVRTIVLVLGEEASRADFRTRFPKLASVVRGGAERQDSVRRGFARLDPLATDVVLVHDGARPLVSAELIVRVVEAARRRGAAVPVVPTADTIKEIAGGRVVRTPDRDRLGRVQTPQAFSYSVLEKALAKAREEGYLGTDEAALVERCGGEVAVVEGDERNIKITTRLDLKIAEVICHEDRPGV